MRKELNPTGTTHFQKFGGKNPWYIIADTDPQVNISYNIYSGYNNRKGFIDDEGRLYVFASPQLHPGRMTDTRMDFDFTSHKSITQAVKLCFLMTQETVTEKRSRQIQDRMMNSKLYNNTVRNRFR